MTWYVTRNPDGAIAMKTRDGRASGTGEALADDHPDIIAFDARIAAAVQPAAIDALIGILIQKGVLTTKDLPADLSIGIVAQATPA